MNRSLRFGSIGSDNCPVKTRFRYDSDGFPSPSQCLWVASSFFNRHVVKVLSLLPLLGSIRFHVLFHSLMGFFSPFSHGTTSLSVTQDYFKSHTNRDLWLHNQVKIFYIISAWSLNSFFKCTFNIYLSIGYYFKYFTNTFLIEKYCT